jgi:hypothetical protein
VLQLEKNKVTEIEKVVLLGAENALDLAQFGFVY